MVNSDELDAVRLFRVERVLTRETPIETPLPCESDALDRLSVSSSPFGERTEEDVAFTSDCAVGPVVLVVLVLEEDGDWETSEATAMPAASTTMIATNATTAGPAPSLLATKVFAW
jgi:hypothetical protein